MQAKVKQDYFLPSLIAFSGVEFTKKEWRAVPVSAEDEAKAHPSLDVREDGEVETVQQKVFPRRRSRKQVEEEGE